MELESSEIIHFLTMCVKIVPLLFFTCIILLIDAQTVSNYICKTNLLELKTRNPIGNLAEYCKNKKKPCAPKCCGWNEVLIRKKINGNILPVCTSTASLGIYGVNYDKLKIYNKAIEQSVNETEKSLLNDFHLVQNRMFENETCMDMWTSFQPYLLENGVFASDLTAIGRTWVKHGTEYFCVDLLYKKKKNETEVYFYVANEVPIDNTKERIFFGVASLISSIFLIPVIFVYCVLPQLRNLSGMLLLAYVVSLFGMFVLRAIIQFFSSQMECSLISAMTYFFCLSSFFWLNIMSFDIWWTFRGQRLKRKIHRRGEIVKFGWYSLYGWGAPLAMTIAAYTVDMVRDQLPSSIVFPMFDACLTGDNAVRYYVYVPVGLLTLINMGLFLTTIYNIWLIKRKLNEFKNNSNNTKNNQYRFGLYIKMSILMGTSWFLEFFEEVVDIPFWGLVIKDLYNALIGVVIFALFVMNKKTLKMLCKRFNIHVGFLENKKFNSTSRSTTKSSTINGSYHRTATTEDSDVEMYETEVNTHPNPK